LEVLLLRKKERVGKGRGQEGREETGKFCPLQILKAFAVHVFSSLKVKIWTLDIVAYTHVVFLHEGTSMQKDSGTQNYTCIIKDDSCAGTPMHLSVNGMNHSCFCLAQPKLVLVPTTNLRGMEG